MKRNMASWDRIGRAILGIVFIILAFTHHSLPFYILGLIGLVFLVTAARLLSTLYFGWF